MDLALSVAAIAGSWLSAGGVLWLILRLRSRGITGVSITDGHQHEYAERNPAKYGDDKRHCNVPGCGEPKPG